MDSVPSDDIDRNNNNLQSVPAVDEVDTAVSALVNMGFKLDHAHLAVSCTDSLESAVTWLFENQKHLEKSQNNVWNSLQKKNSKILSLNNHVDGNQIKEDYEIINSELKMVMVVRIDLGMSPGKVAAQCVHAALGN